MSSKKLNRIFEKSDQLDRDDIQRYASSSEAERHEIELKTANDPFAEDALEGWKSVDYDTEVLKKADRKFLGNGQKLLNISLLTMGAIVTTIVIILLINPSVQNEKNEGVGNNTEFKKVELTAELSDLIIPEKVEKMVEAPFEEQINGEIIKTDFKERKELNLPDVEIQIDDLPMFEIDPEEIAPEIPTDVTTRKTGKEIYLHDFKLLDYREYRSRPTVKTEQLVLSGTPADQEGQSSSSDDPQWKTVDVPYIDYIDKTTKLFAKGKFKRALVRYETILKTYPDDLNGNFYGGLCLYNLEDYQSAIHHFRKCIASPFFNFDEESQWLIGNSYEKLGQTEKARSVYQKIVDQNGYYKKQAQAKLSAK
jgi:tetratricopeptide (TPR) repeat protein